MAGGLESALSRARRIGAEVAQVFPSNPRQWRRPSLSPESLSCSGDAFRSAGIPLFVHTIYLVNLASPVAALRNRSASALADALVFGALIGSSGVVTHVGSHRGEGFARALAWVQGALTDSVSLAQDGLEALSSGAPLPPVLLESSAGSSATVGGTPEELGRILEGVSCRSGVCLDTAHLFAAGFAVHKATGMEALLRDVARWVGLRRVGLIHLNDSKTELGSRKDRHENLGEGRIGRRGLALWVQRAELEGVPFVLETPGFGKEGPDRKNVTRAKRLRALGRSGGKGAKVPG